MFSFFSGTLNGAFETMPAAAASVEEMLRIVSGVSKREREGEMAHSAKEGMGCQDLHPDPVMCA